ncbi:MAG: Adenine DNA glycosylase [Dehalococcoidia bacterium]|nr:Adenine DNA glycosylase [Bacillota bacterium]
MSGTRDARHILEGFPIETLRSDLLQWWFYPRRRFPWRETCDPYRILVAEVLLHRTRADQVVPLYELFLERFPNVQALAKSTPDELLELFYSAGLQWRWKLVHAMAVELQARFYGQIPDDFEQLISLPGVSRYIASALQCFAFGYPEAILDTNTVRVTGRLLRLPITDSSRRSRLFRSVLQSLIDPNRPRDFNFALIDFAAAICRVKSPPHHECPLQGYCRSYKATIGMNSANEHASEKSESGEIWTGSN